MTEQEAEKVAARLTRIWAPDEVIIDFHERKLRYLGKFIGSCVTQIEVRLCRFSNTPIFVFKLVTKEEWNPKLGCVLARGRIKNLSHPQFTHQFESTQQFANEWLPFFRRGCWLSGCPIDATAHEKAEWIQDFTSEEIESWNLKM